MEKINKQGYGARAARPLARRIGAALGAVLLLSFGGVASELRAEMVVEKQRVYLGADLKVLPMRGKKANACQRACNRDKRCQAWTFVRASSGRPAECRMKTDVSRRLTNNCCVSGYKKIEDRRAVGAPRGKKFARCQDWAAAAVRLNERNEKNRCGYRGRAWHSNEKRHFRRCMRLGPKGLRSQRQEQRNAVELCLRELAYDKRARCEHFAKVAVVQSESRVKASCGQGPKLRWAKNYRSAYQWCLDADNKQAAAAQQGRQQFLQRCFAGNERRSGPCNDYAEGAIRQFRQNVRKGCDLHGVSWHNNYRRHVNWCRSNSPKERRRASKKRDIVLKTCKLFGKIGIQWR